MKKVLFLCIGNICRSPIAEALGRTYGADVMEVSSAGLAPALNNHPLTRSALAEIGVELGDHVPKRLGNMDLSGYDLIVNMSGKKIPFNPGVPVETWDVPDPMGGVEEDFRRTRELLEMLVMRLVLRFRAGKN